MEENNLINTDTLDEIAPETNVFSEPTHSINPVVYALMNFGKSMLGFGIWFVELLWSMVLSLVNFFKMVGVGTYKGIIGIKDFFKYKGHQFKYNDKAGKISFALFGYSSLVNKSYVFGIMYMVFQVAYIALFALFGAHSIYMLGSLGTQASYEDPNADFSQLVMGDNSIMILIYGLLWVLSLLIYIYIWNRSINRGYYNYRVNNLLKFSNIYERHLAFGKKIDDEARDAFYQGIKLSDFKKSKSADVEEYLANIADLEERSYVKYLIENSFKHTYTYLKKLSVQQAKLARLEAKRNQIKVDREAGLVALTEKLESSLDEEKNRIKVEVYKNKTISLLANANLKCKSQKHQVEELSKRFSQYIEKQLIQNNIKYGKENNYYKEVAVLDSEIVFYSNYEKFVKIYNDGLVKFDEKNKENEELAVQLLEEMNNKIAKTKTKFAEIRAKKAALNAELKQVELDYKANVANIKASKPADMEELLLKEKAQLVNLTTIIMRKLNDLPTDKNINALEKEEIQESKRAYKRDKKYLKTDYTGLDLAFEEVVNEMVVEHKIDYRLAVTYAKSMFVKEDKELRMVSVDEANVILNEKKETRERFISANPDKYVVKFKSFKEAIASLFDDKFHITILLLPILGIVLFSIIPLIFSIFIAFTNYSKGYEPPTQLFTWNGLENFIALFNPDPNTQFAALPNALRETLGWTLLWAIVATFSNYILGIVVALMINKDGIKFKKLWRTVFVMTIAIPQFISLLSIGTLLKDSGAIGYWYFQTFGQRLGFGTDGSAGAVAITKIVIILVNVWIGIPYTILSTTGILLNIPKDLYESAKVDGTSTFTQFTKITMPYILFVTGPYLITQFIGNINNFNVIFFLTGGGPSLAGSGLLGLGQTDLLITFIYKVVTSTSNPQYGIASAIGIIVFIICSFISIVMYNKSGSIKEEDQFQ